MPTQSTISLSLGQALPRIRQLHIEVLSDEFWEGCAQFTEIQALLKARGFKLHLLDGFRRTVSGDLAYANALYRNGSSFASQSRREF